MFGCGWESAGIEVPQARPVVGPHVTAVNSTRRGRRLRMVVK